MNSVEILDKKNELQKRALEICQRCKDEIRDLTVDENNEIESIKEDITNLNEELRKLDVAINDNKQTKSKTIMNKEFRLLKAINDVANNKTVDEVSNAVINEGASEMRKAGLSFSGQIQIPTETRAAITVTTEGEDVVVTDFTNILEPLRAKNVLIAAGAKFMGGLTGDLQVPNMSASNVTWEGETSAASDGAGTFGNVKLQPKRLTAYIDVSKQFLVQDSLDAEELIRRDLVNAINDKLEATILGSEAGTTTKPQGIFYSASALDEISDFAGLCELESDVEDVNVNGECKYILSNKAKAALRTMQRGGDGTRNVMEGGEIDGTQAFNTSHVEDTNIAYGDWSNLCIGQWGGIDITVDPFSQAKDGKVRIVVNAFFDAKVLREGAIAVASVATE